MMANLLHGWLSSWIRSIWSSGDWLITWLRNRRGQWAWMVKLNACYATRVSYQEKLAQMLTRVMLMMMFGPYGNAIAVGT